MDDAIIHAARLGIGFAKAFLEIRSSNIWYIYSRAMQLIDQEDERNYEEEDVLC